MEKQKPSQEAGQPWVQFLLQSSSAEWDEAEARLHLKSHPYRYPDSYSSLKVFFIARCLEQPHLRLCFQETHLRPLQATLWEASLECSRICWKKVLTWDHRLDFKNLTNAFLASWVEEIRGVKIHVTDDWPIKDIMQLRASIGSCLLTVTAWCFMDI